MECFECGETINPNLRYCLHCGVSLEAMYAAPPTMPADKLPPLPLFMQAAPQPLTVAAARVQPISQPEMNYQLPVIEQLRANIKDPNFLMQVIYFLVIGFWSSQMWLVATWVCALLGLNITQPMLNYLPTITFLSLPHTDGLVTSLRKELPRGLCLLYGICVGWYLSMLWMQVIWLATVSVVGLPLAQKMGRLLPSVMWLKPLPKLD
ncbi:MAG: hypothetical protein LCH85_02900 [Chloroflexi bacterium]|nr:hypothetical protein [Chloroflexota bacterium]